MDIYTVLICVLVGTLVFLSLCSGVLLILTAADIARKNTKEEKKDDPFDETEIAEGN